MKQKLIKPNAASLRPPGRGADQSWETETIACRVADYFCRGHSAAEISDLLKTEHGIVISREAPYRYLAYCTKRNYLRFSPPAHRALAEQLQKNFSLIEVDVADSPIQSGVMERAAEMVFRMIRERARRQKSIRIGCAGGQSMALLMRKVVEHLSQPQQGLPEEIVCQNLVAGFDLEDPRTNPIGYLAPLVGLKPSGVQVKCRLFQAPALVHPEQKASLLELEGNELAAKEAQKCDIIVSSCGGIEDPHQMLQKYYSKFGQAIELLKSRHCVGDMLWLPICADGPLRIESFSDKEKKVLRYVTMSLLELSDLPKLIAQGTNVVLAVAPCRRCPVEESPTKAAVHTKATVLETILRQTPRLVTHLVTETGIAQQISKAG